MAEIDIDYELKHVSGILSDVETLDLPWSEQELAGFDWFMATWAIGELRAVYGDMTKQQKDQLESLRRRTNAVKDKLTALGFRDPFED